VNKGGYHLPLKFVRFDFGPGKPVQLNIHISMPKAMLSFVQYSKYITMHGGIREVEASVNNILG